MDKDELEDALHSPPKAESRSSFATGNPNMRGARAARENLRPGDKFGDPFGVFARYRHRQAQKPAAERVKPLHEQRSAEHTSELKSLMRTAYAVFCLKKKT